MWMYSTLRPILQQFSNNVTEEDSNDNGNKDSTPADPDVANVSKYLKNLKSPRGEWLLDK